jgi:hypothetical protein
VKTILLALALSLSGCTAEEAVDTLNTPNPTQVDRYTDLGMPTDCDFWRSPIGKKGCHYRRSVTVQAVWKRDGRLLCATGAPGAAPPTKDPNQFTVVMMWSDGVLVPWSDCSNSVPESLVGVTAHIEHYKVIER